MLILLHQCNQQTTDVFYSSLFFSLSAFVSRSRCRGVRTEGSDDECPSSVLFLTRQIQTLKKRVRRFEDQFEQDMHYKVNEASTRTLVHSPVQEQVWERFRMRPGQNHLMLNSNKHLINPPPHPSKHDCDSVLMSVTLMQIQTFL